MNDINQQQPDKRHTKRVIPAPDQPVRVDLKGQGFDETTSAVNISEEGIGLSLPDDFLGSNFDEAITVLVKLPEPINHSFSAAAKVVHQQGKSFGVQFESLQKEDVESLSKYIEHRLVNTDSFSLMKMLYGG